VDTQTRHALKQDSFVQATTSGIGWLQNNRSRVIAVTVAIVVILAVLFGGLFFAQSRGAAAQVALGEAMDIYDTPLRPAGQPADPIQPSFASSAERAKAANPKFVDAANRFGWLRAGKTARYFAGLTYLDLGQNSSAESNLKQVADSSDAALAALAKMTLAGLYHQTGRDPQAIEIYKQIIAKPTLTVPASAAKLQLAQLYETSNPTEARRLYAEIKDQDKTTAAAQIAAQKLNPQPK
jgi:predicted negative regulator of RcsB-dependent stress response